MRERLIETLGTLAHTRFLVYLMGPYEAFEVASLFDTAETDGSVDADAVPEAVDFGRLVGTDVNLDRQEATLDLLLAVRDRLRADPGVNAFLAIDIDVPLDEMDAATQSIEFALASNVIVYVVPQIGDNLGVGIEVGSVLETLFRERDRSETGSAVPPDHHERVVFVHEDGVRSAMIAGIRDRWEARVYSYAGRDDLVRQIRLFVRDIARREQRGDLPELDSKN